MEMRFLERNDAVQDGGLRLQSLWDELNPFEMLVYRRAERLRGTHKVITEGR